MEINVFSDGIELVKKSFEDLEADIPKVARGRIYGRMLAAMNRIRATPPMWSGKLPKGWFKSDKQRRYVMMLVRKGLVPYRRTGAYKSGWSVRAITDGYRLQTDVPYAMWVGGNVVGANQSRIHVGRWKVASDAVYEEAIEKLPLEIEGGIIMAARSHGL